MNATIKVTERQVILRLGRGTLTIIKGDARLDNPSIIEVWKEGAMRIYHANCDEGLVEALCAIAGEGTATVSPTIQPSKQSIMEWLADNLPELR